jgi:hypothetical protein
VHHPEATLSVAGDAQRFIPIPDVQVRTGSGAWPEDGSPRG